MISNLMPLRGWVPKPSVSEIAREFIAYYTGPERHPSGGCGNCGGIPHSTTCFVGRFIEAVDEGATNPARVQSEDVSPAIGSADHIAQLTSTLAEQAQEIARLQQLYDSARMTLSTERDRITALNAMVLSERAALAAKAQEIENAQVAMDEDNSTPPRLKSGLTARPRMFLRASASTRKAVIARAERAESALAALTTARDELQAVIDAGEESYRGVMAEERATLMKRNAEAETARDEARKERDDEKADAEHAMRLLKSAEREIARLIAQLQEAQQELAKANVREADARRDHQRAMERAEAAESQLTALREHRRVNVERQADGTVLVCFGDHEESTGCPWQTFVPESQLTALQQKWAPVADKLSGIADANLDTPLDYVEELIGQLTALRSGARLSLRVWDELEQLRAALRAVVAVQYNRLDAEDGALTEHAEIAAHALLPATALSASPLPQQTTKDDDVVRASAWCQICGVELGGFYCDACREATTQKESEV